MVADFHSNRYRGLEIGEELLGMESLKNRTKGIDICDAERRSLHTYNRKLSSTVCVTTDGAPAMVRSKAGAVSLLCDMDIVVKTVHFIKSRGLNHRQFKDFLEQCEAESGEILVHAVKGTVDLPQLSDPEELWDLALLADLTTFLRRLNVKLQGHGKLTSTLFDIIKGFQRKLKLLQGQLKEGNPAHFPTCKALVNKHDVLHHLRSDKNHNMMEKPQEEFHHNSVDFRDHKKSFNLF